MSELNKSITIITSSVSAIGVVALKKAADSLGMHVDILIIDDNLSSEYVSAAQNVIYRISPRTYPIYKKLLSNLTEGSAYESLKSVLASFDKIEIAHAFKEALVPHPLSWVLKKEDTPNSYPVVIKIRHGYQGDGVALLREPEDYLQFLSEYPDEVDYLLQEYIESATAQDKRLIVVGDRIVASMKRTSAGKDFRANLHKGGSAVAYIPTSQEIELAVRATKAFNLTYGGVDIIDSPNGPLVLEVNPSPGFAISKITGIDVAREVVESMRTLSI